MDFLFYVLPSSHSNSENCSSDFLKFHECMTNMMRICLLWTSPFIHCEKCNSCEILGFQIFPSILVNCVIESSNLNLKRVVLMFKGSSRSLLPKFFCKVQNNYVVHKLGLSLIKLVNCCCEFLEMVLFWTFQVKATANFAITEIFIGLWESDEEWFWLFEPYSKLTTFSKNRTLIKIKIDITWLYKQYKVKIKWSKSNGSS